MLEQMRDLFFVPKVAEDGHPAQRGFTLIEMLIVVALIGLILGITIPNLRRSMVRADLLEDVRMLSSAVAVSRINAVKSSQQVVLRLLPNNASPPDRTVIAWVDENADESPTGEETVGSWILKENITLLPDSGNFLHILTGTDRGIVFLPNGTAIAGSTGEAGVGTGAVVVSDRVGNEIRILVQGGAGTITQQMANPETGTWEDQLRFWRY